MKANQKKLVLVGIAGALVLGVILLTQVFKPKQQDPTESTVKIEATRQTETGIELDTAFTVQLDKSVTKQELTENLTVHPSLTGGYLLEGEGSVWTLTPNSPLLPNTVYALKLTFPEEPESSFAFQTLTSLTVRSTTPGKFSQWVEPDTAIQFTFNATGVDISESFTIQPAVEGRFESKGTTATFLPTKPLAEDYTYHISLKAGLKGDSGRILSEDYGFSFSTREYQASPMKDLSLSVELGQTFLVGDTPFLPLSGDGSYLPGRTVSLKLYQYADIQQYAQQLKAEWEYPYRGFGAGRSYTFPTEGLTLVSDQSVELIPSVEGQYFGFLLTLPTDLTTGGYLVEIHAVNTDKQEYKLQTVFQVGEQVTYSQMIEDDQIVVWVNDPATGQPMANLGVEVALSSGADQGAPLKEELLTGTTDASGLVTLDSKGKQFSNSMLFLKEKEKTLFVQPLAFSAGDNRYMPMESTKYAQSFHQVLYTDRGGYLANDTIKFWGVLSPYLSDTPLPENLMLRLSSYSSENLTTVPVTLSAGHTYQGELKLENLEQNSYALDLVDRDGTSYGHSSVIVENYVKPQYIISLTPDKKAYFVGETATFILQAQFYDGTPAAGQAMAFTNDQGEESLATVNLDETGSATITTVIQPLPNWSDTKLPSWNTQMVHYSAYNLGGADSTMSANTMVMVAPSHVGAELSGEIDSRALTAHLFQIDLTSINSKENTDYWQPFHKENSKPADLPITLEILRTTVTKTPIETELDELNLEVEIQYDYSSQVDTVETLKATSKDGSYSFAIGDYKNTKDITYSAQLSFDSGIGGMVGEQHYRWINWLGGMYPERNTTKSYSFFRNDLDSAPEAKVGEEITLKLFENGTEEITPKGKVFYTLLQDKTLDQGFFEGGEHRFIFQKENQPQVQVVGAYFDGRYSYPISAQTVNYNTDESKLNLTVTANKAEYRPGDKLELSVKVTDADGKPAEAEVLISMVDQSVVDLYPDRTDFLQKLYQTESYFYVSQRISSPNNQDLLEVAVNAQKDMASLESSGGGPLMGGGGGDGGVTIRKDFLDTAYFETIQTKSDGTGSATISLPDNVTSWRIQALAYTTKVEGGQQETSSIVTLPFFIAPVITEHYLVGDDIVVAIIGAGVDTAAKEPIAYTVLLESEDGTTNQEKTEEGEVGVPLQINFGKLPKGDYTATLTGSNGKLQDGIEQKFSVVEQLLSRRTAKLLPIDQLDKIQPLRYPVEITLYDPNLKPYMEVLDFITSQWGQRVEILVASNSGEAILLKMNPYSGGKLPSTESILSPFQRYETGGIAPLLRSDTSLDTTVKLNFVLEDAVGGGEYYQSLLSEGNTSPDELALILVGQAALGKPVLNDIRILLGGDQPLLPSSRLYLGAALARLGDYDGARKVYEEQPELLAQTEKLTELTDAQQQTLFGKIAPALLLTSEIGHSDADLLAGALVTHSQLWNQRVTYHLELLHYLKNYRLPQKGEFSTVSYTDAQKIRQTISFGEKELTHTVTLGRTDLENAGFESEGSVEARVAYLDYLSEQKPTDLVKVTKEIIPADPVKGLTTAAQAEVLITMEFAENAPEGLYTLRDVVPAGMRPMPNHFYGNFYPNGFGCWFYNFTQEGQQVTGRVFYHKPEPGEPAVVTYSYTVLGTLAGGFKVESTALSDSGQVLHGISAPTTIQIADNMA